MNNDSSLSHQIRQRSAAPGNRERVLSKKLSSNAVDMITPSMHTVLNQIIHCPFSGTVRQLFLEGKVMELMAYKLELLAAKKVKRDESIFIKPDDVDRVRYKANKRKKYFFLPIQQREVSP